MRPDSTKQNKSIPANRSAHQQITKLLIVQEIWHKFKDIVNCIFRCFCSNLKLVFERCFLDSDTRMIRKNYKYINNEKYI